MFDTIGPIMSQAREGNVRALGVASARRSSIATEVPSLADTPPGFDVSAFYGIGVRAGTPKDIGDVIERDTQAAADRSFQIASVRSLRKLSPRRQRNPWACSQTHGKNLAS